MPLLKGNDFVDDTWHTLDNQAVISDTGDLLVSFSRLLRDYEKLSKRDSRLGVVFPNSEATGVLETFLPDLSLIVLDFPAFTDGRAYSQARHLRQQGYTGELRASGNVLPDQLAFMAEVGFDAFHIDNRFPEHTWQNAIGHINLRYQSTQEPLRRHIWQARRDAPERRFGQG